MDSCNNSLSDSISNTSSNTTTTNTSSGESRTNLIVNYLPQTMVSDEFKSLFQSIGPVMGCKLIRNKATNQNLGYGFVNYSNSDDAERAILNLDGIKIENKVIKVSYARPSSDSIKGANLYISNMPKTWSCQNMNQFFSVCGKIITSRILCNQGNGQSKGVGFIRFDQRQEADLAIQKFNNILLQNEPITVKYANYPIILKTPSSYIISNNQMQSYTCQLVDNLLSASSWCIFVYNLSPETDDSILWQLFGPFGAVQSVKVIRNYLNQKCKGFGFVTMTSYDHAVNAINSLNGVNVANRVLQVSFKSN